MSAAWLWCSQSSSARVGGCREPGEGEVMETRGRGRGRGKPGERGEVQGGSVTGSGAALECPVTVTGGV